MTDTIATENSGTAGQWDLGTSSPTVGHDTRSPQTEPILTIDRTVFEMWLGSLRTAPGLPRR